MNKNQVKEFLKNNKGYLKWGAGKLAKKLNANFYHVVEAMKELKSNQIVIHEEIPVGRGILKAAQEAHSRFFSPKDLTEEVIQDILKSFAKEKAKKNLEPYTGGNPNNVLVIGDTHEPFCKEGYLEFCRETQEKYDCGTVIHIGDLVDNHAISYHEKDVEGRSAGDEYRMALERCREWYRVFPDVKICIGNHDALPFRKAFTAGLPASWLKSYQEILESPKSWEWDFTHEVAGVIYQHGTGLSGEMAAINAARENRQSTVIGHLHTVCNTRYLASFKDLIFGVSVGCGIDHEAYAFAYGRQNTRKPVISCAVVLNGELPINIPMNY
jgi:predicted phosphodiesterase